MKKGLAVFLVCLLLLTGCAGSSKELDRGMALREKMLQSGCSFKAHVTADYGDKTYTFSMECLATREGGVQFTVLSPETIHGITGVLSASGGKLTFDAQAVAFEMLADGELSPVSAPWLLVRTLQSGYLSDCSLEDGALRLTMDDSYEEEALRVDIWLNSSDLPQRADFLWQGRRVLSITVEGFSFV